MEDLQPIAPRHSRIKKVLKVIFVIVALYCMAKVGFVYVVDFMWSGGNPYYYFTFSGDKEDKVTQQAIDQNNPSLCDELPEYFYDGTPRDTCHYQFEQATKGVASCWSKIDQSNQEDSINASGCVYDLVSRNSYEKGLAICMENEEFVKNSLLPDYTDDLLHSSNKGMESSLCYYALADKVHTGVPCDNISIPYYRIECKTSAESRMPTKEECSELDKINYPRSAVMSVGWCK